MFEALVVWFVLAVPWVLGYATGRYRGGVRQDARPILSAVV